MSVLSSVILKSNRGDSIRLPDHAYVITRIGKCGNRLQSRLVTITNSSNMVSLIWFQSTCTSVF